MLEEKNPNKIPPKLRGTMLWARLYCRAKDCAKKIPREILTSKNGAKAFVAAVHRRDPFSVVSTVYSDFAALVSSRRADNETYKAFEALFYAAVSRFRSHGDDITIPEPLLALMLLHSARMNDNQRVSILAASVTSMTTDSLYLFGNISLSEVNSSKSLASSSTSSVQPSSLEQTKEQN